MADTIPSSKESPPSAGQLKPVATDGKTKSWSNHFLCKLSLFIVFVVAIPLFPSQAPEFVSQAILVKFWEPVRLLFIGLAVSCGCSLFCSKNTESESLQVYHSEDSHNSFVSRIFHVCPIFEDGYENLSANDDKIPYKEWNFHESSHKDGNFDKIEMWNNQFIQSEPMLVLSETDQQFFGVNYKPLGLPVRSLTSTSNEAVHDFNSIDSSKKIGNGKKFGDFEEMMAEMGEGSVKDESLESFDFQVDESEVKAQSFGSSTSQTSSLSPSPPRFSSSSSYSSEMNSEGDEQGKSKSFQASNPPLKSVNEKMRLNAFHLRRYSSGSLFKKDDSPLLDRVEESVQVASMKREKKHGKSSKKHVAKTSNPVEMLTVVSDEPEEGQLKIHKAEMGGPPFLKRIEEPVEVMKKLDKAKQEKRHGKSSKKHVSKTSNPVDILNSLSDDIETDLKTDETEVIELPDENKNEEMEKSSENVGLIFAEAPLADSSGYESHEVDRKADEFIAKFKEQIRLQKEASMDRARGR